MRKEGLSRLMVRGNSLTQSHGGRVRQLVTPCLVALCWLPPFLLFLRSWTAAHGPGQLTFRVGLLTSVKPLWKDFPIFLEVCLLSKSKSSQVDIEDRLLHSWCLFTIPESTILCAVLCCAVGWSQGWETKGSRLSPGPGLRCWSEDIWGVHESQSQTQ